MDSFCHFKLRSFLNTNICGILFVLFPPLIVVEASQGGALSGLDGPDFSAGPQTSPISPLWSPLGQNSAFSSQPGTNWEGKWTRTHQRTVGVAPPAGWT